MKNFGGARVREGITSEELRKQFEDARKQAEKDAEDSAARPGKGRYEPERLD